MDFGFSEEQELLRESARGFLRAKAPPAFARAMLDDPVGVTAPVWSALADLGWLGLIVPDAYGGSGLGYLDLAVVLEECGAVVLPGPFVTTVALATPAIRELATAPQQERWLPAIAAGTLRATLAFAEAPGRWAEEAVEAEIEAMAGGYRVRGTKLFVPDARSSDLILVVGRLGGRTAVIAVPRDADGVTVQPMHGIDGTRKLDAVSLAEVRIDGDALLGGDPAAPGSISRLVDIARVLLSAEMCGAADAALSMSVEYAQIRTQFDRAIATFQSLQHKMADMKVLLENARSLVYYAAWALDSRAPDAPRAAAMTKAYASDACVKIVADAIQVHGGIGFTWEHDLHLYFKRVKAAELTYGDASENRALVAEFLDL